ANEADGCQVVGEQAVEHVGHGAHLQRVETAPALIVLQHREAADIEAEAMSADDRLGECGDITKAEIETLAGEGMNAVRRVAGKSKARRDETAGNRQAQRKGGGLVE